MSFSIWRAACLVSFASHVIPCMAAQNEPELSEWYSCTDHIAETKEANQAEEQGGRFGYEEFLIEKCGFRPVLRIRGGRIALSNQDCEMLYRWSKEGYCEPKDFSWNQATVIKQLNPRVFSIKRFSDWCNANNLGGAHEDLATFSRRVCQSLVESKDALKK